jgi:hypothetical protein
MKTLNEILENKANGLYYNNRLILPFQAHFLKIIIDDEVITDFSPSSKGIYIREEADFTDLYFLEYKHINDAVSKYEAIKVVVVEKGENIFDFSNHKKLAIYLEEKHKTRIEKSDDDILFIE